jgi:hypothetical protein
MGMPDECVGIFELVRIRDMGIAADFFFGDMLIDRPGIGLFHQPEIYSAAFNFGYRGQFSVPIHSKPFW